VVEIEQEEKKDFPAFFLHRREGKKGGSQSASACEGTEGEISAASTAVKSVSSFT